ncbi:MAG TPA: glycosyltransferase family 39 protein [Candidatus Cybelea sp.]|jgi:4-amino-4-deoxy-L-arabinose transferase-like glycosyltransferase|nr:glycosyltransferase family 39 protein [Candidatus Cybelea sp.]
MRSGLPGRIPLAAAAVTLAIHLVGNPHYGFFRDELYFIICGFHPAWGYVDQPPVVPLIAAGSQLFGHSLFAIRAVCALFAAACVYTTVLLVIELGGGVFAEAFGALLALITPALMDFGMKLSTDTVGLWLWPLLALYLLRIVKGADPRWWLAAGAVTGVALESKYTVAFLAVGMVAGLLLTPQRRVLRTPWFVAGVAVAALVELPNVLWQGAHGFPMLALLHAAGAHRNTVLSPLQYLSTQLLVTHPLLAPFWLIGLVALLRREQTRFLGLAYLFLIGAMVVLHGKDYYPADVYPIPIAAGAVAVEALTAKVRWWRPALAIYVVVAGGILVPLLMPILPERTMSAYDEVAVRMVAGEVALAKSERTDIGNLPPDWGDMHGWQELAATVAGIYRALPPGRRAQAAILASNYGEAAALDFYGPQYGLPPALSGNNQYWLWGPRGKSGSVLIDVHGDCMRGAHLYRYRRVVARFSNPWGRPFENGFPISLCEGITQPLAAYWPQLRAYI